MHLRSLDLTDYRNYASLHLDLEPGTYVLEGDNAQGKSNLCEAIRLLSTLRSFRAAHDRELVRWQAEGHFARVTGRFERAQGPVQIEVIISAPPEALPADHGTSDLAMPAPHLGQRKRVRINGTPRRALDCVGMATVVLFEPTDLDLVIGSPSGRRHFMDVTLCQISQVYCRALAQYQRILTQRAALLKRIRDNLDDPRSLTYWDEQMATHAIPLITERAGLITRCTPPADEVALRLGGRSLRLAYAPSFTVAPGTTTTDARQAFLEALQQARRRELAQGVNLVGPHRDDLHFFEGPIDLAMYGSRGQQRVAALALKLAELEAIETETGDQPILVLDDVLSELDQRRRQALLAHIADLSQVFLATAEPEVLPEDFRQRTHLLPIRQGTIG